MSSSISTKHTDAKSHEAEQNTATTDTNDVGGAAAGVAKEPLSKRQRLRKLFKSPAVESYEKNVSKEHKDWGTGNQFGGGPYRPLSMTPGAADYYTAKGASGH